MWRKISSVLLTAALLAGTVPAPVSVLGQQKEEPMPLKAWYTAPAADWESEATPIGNGSLGGMISAGWRATVSR